MEGGRGGGYVALVTGHEHDLICDGASVFVVDVVGAREDDARGDCEGRSVVDVFGPIRLLVSPKSLQHADTFVETVKLRLSP